MFPIKIRQVHVNSTIPKCESQLKTWLIICFQTKFNFFFFFFSFHTCHTWGLINIKMLSHSIRISSWLRRNSPALWRKTISSRLIDLSLYPHRDYFLPCDGFFYIESAPGCIFSTQTRSADISSKINCWEWFVESETKTSAVTWQHANYHSRNSVEVQSFSGFTRIKLSNHANAADWYMWNITDILPNESCVDMTYPDNMLAGLADLTVTKQCAVKQ